MSKLSDANIIKEFQEFDIQLEYGSNKLDKLREIGIKHNFDAGELCNEWVAYSTRNGNCELDSEIMERWEGHLHSHSKKTPLSRRTVSKTGNGVMYTGENLSQLFGDDLNDADDDIMGAYGTPEDKKRLRGQKRTLGQTTPTTPTPLSKSRHTHNGATPHTPRHPTHSASNGTPATPVRSMLDNSMISSTPAAKYNQRQNCGSVVCALNEANLPQSWSGIGGGVTVHHYHQETALKAPYQYMFQKVSEKALTLIERIEILGDTICKENSLPEPLSVAQPSLEPAVFTGQVVCEGEGHLNARSCLLEGPIKTRRSKGFSVKLEIPDHVTCSLFPGQVIAVEGINNYNGVLIPSTVYDEGVIPPAPKRNTKEMPGFTMLAAAGPFTTSDSLEMEPLRDLLRVVEVEKPDVLLLLGPFVDSTHPSIKECNLPDDMTFDEFFKRRVLPPIYQCMRSSRSKLILVPSQRDVHHPWVVYPQPPFQFQEKTPFFSAPDPATLSVNGLCVGVTSTDVLFHLSARTMFKGPTGDRMARVARHILCQQCYYPLVPAFRRDDGSSTKKVEKESENPQLPSEESMEVTLDLVHTLDYQYAMLPVRPDLLLLPSDLKPFAKKMDGCVCINPGRLTKKASGGTYVKIRVPHMPTDKLDFSSDIAVQIVYI